MKKTAMGIGLALAASVLVAAAPLGASGEQRERLVNAIRVELAGPARAEGEFAACCAVNDSGTVEVVFADAKPGEFDATRTFTGMSGCTYTDRIRGTFGPAESLRQVVRGHWKILTGAGTCADLRGGGKFIGVLDLTTSTVKGTNFGGARAAR